MLNRIGVHVYLWLILILAVSLVVSCTPKEEEVPQPPDTPDQQSQPADENPSEEPAESSQVVEPPSEEVAGRIREIIGSREELTAEAVDEITAYGVFRYPDSEFIPDSSLHQLHPDGTEIYRLGFGVGAQIDTVADWYRGHLEAGVEEKKLERASGVKIAGFQYEYPTGNWNKTITVTGMPGENASSITVTLVRRAEPPPSDDEAGDEGSGESGEDQN